MQNKVKIESSKPFKDESTGALILNRYRIVRKLAEGGMGVVYLARSEGVEGFVKPVVVKLILPGLATKKEYVGMFVREAKILANLQDPGIVNIIELSKEASRYVMVLEYVHGFSVLQWLQYLRMCDRRIPTPIAIQIMIYVLDALSHVHTFTLYDGTPASIVHRDISPGNILIDVSGRVKLLDFGIARMHGDATGGYKTETNSFKGKLSYAAPELLKNQPPSVLSDLYTCGVVLHELLVGVNEFFSLEYATTVKRVMAHTLSSVSINRDDAPLELDVIIRKAAHKDPTKRYQNAEQFADALRGTLKTDEKSNFEWLKALVGKDFLSDMADWLGVEPLQERNQAWREPSGIIPPPIAIEEKSQDEHLGQIQDESSDTTIIGPPEALNEFDDRPQVLINKQESKSSAIVIPTKFLLGIVALLLVIIALGGLLLFLYGSENSSSQNSFLLVQTPAGDKITDKTAIKNIKPIPEASTLLKGDPSMLDYSEVFKQRQNAIYACFEQHDSMANDMPELSIFFQVNQRGEVTNASIIPEELNQSNLGKCVRSVALFTAFGKRKEAVSFIIPLTVKREN